MLSILAIASVFADTEAVTSSEISASQSAGIRERNRIALTAEILTSARRHLAEHGSSGLSLRAITRDLGMASSAIYRYFPSRDELLTALIIEAYNSLAEVVEDSEEKVKDRGNFVARWCAIADGMRTWALLNPHSWALIYGTPIIGYAAPQDTIASATRATGPLLQLMVDLSPRSPSPLDPKQEESGMLDPNMHRILSELGGVVSEEQMAEGLGAWAEVVGLISLELFGHMVNVVEDLDAHFTYLVEGIGRRLGET